MARLGLLLLIVIALPGCGADPAPLAGPGAIQLQAWAHAGQAGERRVIQEQVARFNELYPDVQVALTLIPKRMYNVELQSAAAAGELPDLFEFEAPYLYGHVQRGRLRRLDYLLPGNLKSDLLPSMVEQGSYRGRLYAVGGCDSGLGLFASRKALQRVGARIPTTPDEAWSVQEFTLLLKILARQDRDGAVLDLKLNYPGQWFTFAFAPALQSAGGGLIEDSGREPRAATGVLNGPASVAALTRVQSWLRNGYVDANVDDRAFVSGRVALSWTGHWEYPRYAEALGDDLLLLPLPDFGHGSRTGQGSWLWGINAEGRHAEAAARFLHFLLQPAEVLAMAEANGAVPARQSVIDRSEHYRPGGPLHLFVRQLRDGHAVSWPRSPAYVVISTAFQQAFLDIRRGVPAQVALDRAAAAIDRASAARQAGG